MASTTPKQGEHGKQDGERDDEQPGLPEVAERVVEEASRERVPTGLTLRRGRVLLPIYALVLLLVGALAFAAHAISVLPGDLAATRELQETSNPAVFDLMYGVSYIGYPLLSGIIFAIVVALLAIIRLRLAAIFLALTLVADGIGALLKVIVGRHRPLPDLVHVTQQLNSPSFPSGHALHYTVFYGFLAFVLATEFRSTWLRNVLFAICLLLVVLVGPSRVYLGEHWTSDVIGGYLIGFLCLVPLIGGYLWAKRRYGDRLDRRAAR